MRFFVAVAIAAVVIINAQDYTDEYGYGESDEDYSDGCGMAEKDAQIAALKKELADSKSKNSDLANKNRGLKNMLKGCTRDLLKKKGTKAIMTPCSDSESNDKPAFCSFITACNAMGQKECQCAASGLYRIYRKYYGLTYTTWKGLGFAIDDRVAKLDLLTEKGLLPKNNCAMDVPQYKDLKKPGEKKVQITDGLDYLYAAGVSARAWPFVLSRWTEEGHSDNGAIEVAPFQKTRTKFNLLGGQLSCEERTCLVAGAAPALDPETGEPKKSLFHLKMFSAYQAYRFKRDVWATRDICKKRYGKSKARHAFNRKYCVRVSEDNRKYVKELKRMIRWVANKDFKKTRKNGQKQARSVLGSFMRNLFNTGILDQGLKLFKLEESTDDFCSRPDWRIVDDDRSRDADKKRALNRCAQRIMFHRGKRHRVGWGIPFGGKRRNTGPIMKLLKYTLSREVDLADSRSRGAFNTCTALKWMCEDEEKGAPPAGASWLPSELAKKKTLPKRQHKKHMSGFAREFHKQSFKSQTEITKRGYLQADPRSGKLLGLANQKKLLEKCVEGKDKHASTVFAQCNEKSSSGQRRRLNEYSVALT